MREAVIVSTARTPIGRAFRGALNNSKSPTLMGHAIRHAVLRAGIEGGRIDGRFAAEIVLRPRLKVSVEADRERALRILDKSEKYCLVSASISTPIRVEPEIRER